MLKETTFKIKAFVPFLIAILTFISVSIFYFSPVLKGKQIFQSDIQQFRGMSNEIKDFREKNDAEPYWTDAAFGGMPSYQLSTLYPNNLVKKLDSVLRFLPRPADYLFLYFLGFFVLLLVLQVDWKLSILGALGFGFSTYFIIILGVGHNAKAHAIGYMPLVIAGFLLVFQNRLFQGFLLTTVAMALELQASHPQMTYYLGFSLLLLGAVFLKEQLTKKLPLIDFFKQAAIVILGSLLALGMNASSLLATKEYAAFSTRGKSDLTITAEGKQKEATSGLSKEYITEYSYGKLETFNLFIPRFVGGANSEDLGTDSNTYAFLKGKIDPSQARQFVKSLPTYWGSQPIVAAPAYIGAIFIFLFVLGLFIVDSPLKDWLVATTIFSILMSWGHNFEFLTNFFIDYVPLYNKFRAVSSIQVLAELAIPLLGMLALQKIVFQKLDQVQAITALKKTLYILGGFALLFVLFGTGLFSFTGANDAYYNNLLPGLGEAIVADRKMIFFQDSLRSFVLVLVLATLLYLRLKNTLKTTPFVLVFGALLLFDTVGVAIRYVNADDFQSALSIERPFVKTAIDKEILKDKGHYRVANLTTNFMNDGATSYFHKSIGGYHAAKLGRYQDIADFYLSKNNLQVMNMFNTKYFILPQENSSKKSLQVNPDANGNAWFVSDVKLVSTPDEEILSLSGIDTKNTAVVNQLEFPSVAATAKKIQKDSLATIQLLSYQANELKYSVSTANDNLAVFSEIYYKDGWNAYIDGTLTSHFRANYLLRGLLVPKGMHTIVFKFEPTIISKGNFVNLASLVLFLVMALFGVYQKLKTQD